MDPVKVPGLPSNTAPASLPIPPINQAGRSGNQNTESFEPHNQDLAKFLDGMAPGRDLVDDDIQLVLSVPRRRKKKRKRFAFSQSPLRQYQEMNYGTEIPKIEGKSMAAEYSARRRSTSVVQRLESCHLGGRPTGNRRGSLPAVPITINAPLQQMSWPSDPAYLSNSNLHYTSFPASFPWWDQSIAPLPQSSVESTGWHQWPVEDNTVKKRKFEDGWYNEMPARKHYRGSTQISPRTNPTSMTSMARFNTRQASNAPSNAFDRQMSDHSTDMTWPSFDWEPYRVVNPQYVSPYAHSIGPMDIGDAHQNSMSHHPGPFHDWSLGANMFHQDFDSNHGNRSMLPPTAQHSSPSASPTPSPMLPGGFPVQPPTPPVSAIQQQSFLNNPVPLQTPASPPCRAAHAVSPIATASMKRAGPPFSPNRQSSSSPVISRANLRIPNASDITRKPSLYGVPAWPSTTPAPPTSPVPTTQISTTTTNQHVPTSPGQQNPVRRPSIQNGPASMSPINAPPQAPVIPQQLEQPTVVANTPPLLSPPPPTSISTSSPTSSDQLPLPRAESFQIPRARAGRKHSPNIIVDIAETCQEVFPFAEVAERHGVPLQKVFDTFSAIIQLPLLRNADDRRRHGSLGKRRMKEYRDAKRAMERAQQAEKKAEMKAMGAKVDETTKKSQAQAQTSGTANANGLLKSAIMNNAGKSQGTAGV